MSNPNTPQPKTFGEYVEITLFEDKANGRKLGKGKLGPRIDQLRMAWDTVDAAKRVHALNSAASEPKGDPEAIYQAYPRHIGHRAAIIKITKMLESVNYSYLLERTKRFASCVAQWPESERKYVPHPATWFNQGRYEDNPKEWELKIVKEDEPEAPRTYNKF